MSFWTLGDVFEEGGVVQDPFHGGFGLIAAGGIKKPSFYGFSLLHQLGQQRLANRAEDMIVTRRSDGALVIALWNLVDLDHAAQGLTKTVRLEFSGLPADRDAAVSRTDEEHGNPLSAHRPMGSPRYPTRAQIAALNKAPSLPPAESVHLTWQSLEIKLLVNGLAIVTISAK